MSKTKQKSIEELLEEALVPEEEQPYKVPENWVWVYLKAIADVKGGKRLPKGHSLFEEPTGYPYLRVTDFDGDSIDLKSVKYINEDTAKKISRYTISQKDVFISIAGTIGKTGIIPEILDGAFLTENAAKITNIKLTFNKFLHLYMKSTTIQEQIKRSIVSTSQPKLALFRIKDFFIVLPPFSEQKRIVEKIERLFAKIDEAKRLIEEVKESFELRKISIIKRIIDEGKEDAQKRGWKFDSIKNVFQITGGGTPSKSNESYWNGTIPWITPKDMKTLYIQEAKDYITEEGLNNSSAKMVTKGSIAMVVRSGILQHSLPVAYLMTDCTVNQDLKVFNSGDELVNKYFLWYVKANEKYLLNEYSKAGTTVNSIEIEKFKSHVIPIPPKEEIETKITKIESIVNKELDINICVDQISQLENLKQVILYKAFRGELGTNDPTEESAIELLKAVLQSK